MSSFSFMPLCCHHKGIKIHLKTVIFVHLTCFVQVEKLKLFCQLCKSKQKRVVNVKCKKTSKKSLSNFGLIGSVSYFFSCDNLNSTSKNSSPHCAVAVGSWQLYQIFDPFEPMKMFLTNFHFSILFLSI